jgi:hypothetical protein
MVLRHPQRLFKGWHMDSCSEHLKSRIVLKRWHCLLLILVGLPLWGAAQQLLLKETNIEFISVARLELIKANNKSVTGVIDLQKQQLLIYVKNDGFKGFNSPLQQEHFFENYLEIHKYPKSTFSAKLIDSFDPEKNGIYHVRAKGILDIHGRQKERIIKVQIEVKGELISFQSQFSLLLEDHDVAIPRIVYQKIAEEIQVKVTGVLKP